MSVIEDAVGDAAVEVDADQFATLVADMSRFLAGLTSMTPFKASDVGLAEWVALSALAKAEDINPTRLARHLGITRERIDEVVGSLSGAKLISIAPAPQDGAGNRIRITDSGKAQLATINSQLTSMLAAVLKARPRTLSLAHRQIRSLMPLFHMAKAGHEPEGGEREPVRARQINRIAQLIGAKSYLEIGIAWGRSFFATKIANKVGVDPHFRFNIAEQQPPGVKFHETTSDNFFQNHPKSEKFDLIFIDGLHVFDQALRDFHNSIEASHPGTVFIIDDVVPYDEFGALPDARQARLLREKATGTRKGGWHGDVYKVIFAIHDLHPEFTFVTTLVNGNGKTILWRQPRQNVKPVFGSIESIDRIGYAEFLRERSLLNLQSEEDAFQALTAWWGTKR